jgi:hypothetical protein
VLGGSEGGAVLSWNQAAKWLTWAYTDVTDSSAIHYAGIKTMYYTQPNRQGPGGAEYSSDETTFAHDCSGSRIHATNYPSHYLMDPSSSHLGQLWHSEVQTVTSSWGGVYDAIYEDLSDTIIYTTAKPCGFVQSNWTAASNNLNSAENASGIPLVYNGLAVLVDHSDGSKSPSASIALNATSSGGMFEGCYTSSSPSELVGSEWLATEDTEIQMAQAHKTFFCRGLANGDGAASVSVRLWQLASFLLTYDPNTSVLGESFATPGGFHVFPEMGLVATQPLVSEPGDISSLAQSGGAYGREYKRCYLSGHYVGPCAIAVNVLSYTTVPFPWPTKYHHALFMAGEGIYDGGAVSTTGTLSTTMGKMTGVIALP